MKANIKSLFSICVAATLITGCTDLDVAVESQYTEYPTDNEIAVEAKMADVYYQLRGTFGRRYMEVMSLSSDEYTAVSYGGGWYDSGAYAHPSFHNFTAEDATIDWMGNLTSGCTKANQIIRDLGGDEAGSIIAPARAMRAFFHFIMMDCWGDAPILNKLLNDGEYVDRSPRKEVAEFIEKELKEIIPQLTDEVSSNTYGKPTKWMAEALLIKLYINWPVYTAESVDKYDASAYSNPKLNDCIALCDDIIKSGKFNLGSMTYQKKFGPDNGANVEDFIYAMPYDTYTEKGLQYGRARTWKAAKDVEISYYGMQLSQSAGGYITMTPEFAELFEDASKAGDRAKSVLMGPVYVYNPTTYEPTQEPALDTEGKQIVLTKDITLETPGDPQIGVGDNLKGYNQGYRSVKFFVIDDDYRNGRDQSNDLPIFRYADILLTKAEAILRGGTATNGDTPESLMNQIRAYVHADNVQAGLSKEQLLDELYDERGREFFDENWRRNDMIRFGHFEDEFFPHYKTGFSEANFDKTRRIFPLHRDMLNTNPNWKQNPGYPEYHN
ncbi:RagB/SusD family nutrient uptake outer membrane protein [uncultured Bacteroides sp.]|uniref:RagB/SusD family nutrient uptake outer membrane protein n=1 Tax=uncultured Bacteroides sp. TaxID=162156 RepID=UPI00280A6EFD|nr:RagB/SusD family nutrient uptake outer membrane protein [uncultured Bacteroides sp.]